VINEHAQFNQSSQLLVADHFITEIYRFTDNCKLGKMNDQLMRDRLVVRVCNSTLSEHLQLEADLTLDKAKKFICQREAVRTQQDFFT